LRYRIAAFSIILGPARIRLLAGAAQAARIRRE
jgi:hypothetical protein